MGKYRDNLGSRAGRAAKKFGHTSPPKILGFFLKFPHKSLNSFLSPNLEIWKKIKKGNPNLWITTLLRSHKHVDVIILARENQGHPLPRNLGGLAQGNSTP
jgi:hypothetical protein